jgi:hypothetical protein
VANFVSVIDNGAVLHLDIFEDSLSKFFKESRNELSLRQGVAVAGNFATTTTPFCAISVEEAVYIDQFLKRLFYFKTGLFLSITFTAMAIGEMKEFVAEVLANA